jgi:hypothetical protein
MPTYYYLLSESLYQDKFCSLNSTNLTVFNSFERLGASHVISITDIEWISDGRDLNLGRWDLKGWGIGLSTITWARDMNRSPILPTGNPDFKKLIVVKVRGAIFKIGFTCEHPDRLFQALEGVLPGIRKSGVPQLPIDEGTDIQKPKYDKFDRDSFP